MYPYAYKTSPMIGSEPFIVTSQQQQQRVAVGTPSPIQRIQIQGSDPSNMRDCESPDNQDSEFVLVQKKPVVIEPWFHIIAIYFFYNLKILTLKFKKIAS